MLDFIRLLKFRYQTVLNQPRSNNGEAFKFQQQIHSLALAEAFLLKGELIHQHRDHPLQIAVIGPTQVGKSSLVNLLLPKPLAGVSPLAGFTTHPHGFALHRSNRRENGEAAEPWLEAYFKPWHCYPQDALPRDQLNSYAYTPVASSPSHALPSCSVWDTPDFDSIDAETYRDSVLRVAALADVILLVVSKDKYADQSVWAMMQLLEPLAQPTVICLNKVTAETRPIISRSLQQKWHAARSDKVPPITALSYSRDPTDPAELAPLISQLAEAAGAVRRRKQPDRARQLLTTHWTNWTAPVIAEHKALEQWNRLVDQSLQNALKQYRRDYLDHPHHYETFQHAMAELLTLLEIPGIAAVFKQTRRVLTWPVRKVISLRRRTAPGEPKNQEHEILEQIQQQLLTGLIEQALQRSEQADELPLWWREITHALRDRRDQLSDIFMLAVDNYSRTFQPEIEASAMELYRKLQQQPLTLNSLRATRLTTDAAAMALTLKTGGIGLHDFILAPAVLSLTSLLTESALGAHMNRVDAALKQRQYARVSSELFGEQLQRPLHQLPQQLDDSEHFNITAETLTEAEAQLKPKRHGLRFR